jgi:hypothetical protein
MVCCQPRYVDCGEDSSASHQDLLLTVADMIGVVSVLVISFFPVAYELALTIFTPRGSA